MPVPESAIQRFINSETAKAVAGRAAAGAAGGALLGGYANPYLFGYEDNPRLRGASALINSIIYGGMAGLGGRGWSKIIAKHPVAALSIPGSMLGGELVPVGLNLGAEATQAAKALAEKPPTASEQIRSFAMMPETRGAAAGAALAGLGGIITGLMRPRRESEIGTNTTRLGMVKKDILTFLIPAMIAGGLIGHTNSPGPASEG